MSNINGFDILLRFIRILVSKKRMIFVLVFFPTLIAIISVFTAQSTYKAAALVEPPTSQGFSPLDFLKESGDGGALSSLLGGSETEINDCMNILGSVRFAKIVIDRFDLETAYKFKRQDDLGRKYYFADVVKQFQQNAKFELTSEEDAINISMTDRSPERARDIDSFMVFALDSLYTDIQKTAIQHRLEYIDGRLSLAETEMKNMEDSLVDFQSHHNLLVPETQVRLILENATQTELQVENLKEDLGLEAAMRGTSSARYRDLTVQKNLLQKTLEGDLRNQADSNSLILPTHLLPALLTEYVRRDRAYNIKLGVYKYLVQEAEALKLEANKNMQVISIIDPPWTNDKRVSPKRRVIVEAVFILSLILATVLAVLLTMWERHMDGNPETRKLISEIKRSLFRF